MAIKTNLKAENASTVAEDEDVVKVMTIHASKGLEFTAVIVMGCEERIMPSPLADRIEEERRLA